jgi:C4-dicarboxylate-specific signal transduction histidine kinase
MVNSAHAMEHASKKELTVRISYAKNVMKIEISDSGTGVPEDKFADIWEPFFTTKELGKGTGLGLPIIKNIVKEHKGNIIVSNKPEGGACFMIYLPVSAVKPEDNK